MIKISTDYRDHTGLRNGPTCLVCGSRHVSHVFHRQDFSVNQCDHCGVRFLDLPPDDAALAAVYTTDYLLADNTAKSQSEVAELKRATARLYLDLLRDQTGKESGCLLDVGCGIGELLAEAQSRGFEVTGVEISSYAATVANRRLGGERVLVGTIEVLNLPTTSFDVVVLSDVVEHVRDPLLFLRRAHDLLKPGGTALMVTPSLDSWSARLLRRYWMEYKSEHLLYFNERSARLTLETAGFTGVVVLPNVKVLSFDYVNRHFQRFPVPLITPCLSMVRKITPYRWAHRPVRLVASGITAIARK